MLPCLNVDWSRGKLFINGNSECVLSSGGWFHPCPGQCYHIPHQCVRLPLITPLIHCPPILSVSIETCACHQHPQILLTPSTVCFCYLLMAKSAWITVNWMSNLPFKMWSDDQHCYLFIWMTKYITLNYKIHNLHIIHFPKQAINHFNLNFLPDLLMIWNE